jgi:hypothetical protein
MNNSSRDRRTVNFSISKPYTMLVPTNKIITVTGRGNLQGRETPKLPYFLDNGPTDGGEVVSLTHRPHLKPQEDSWYSFLLEPESTQGHSAAARIRSIEKSNDYIGNRIRDLPGIQHSASQNTLPHVLCTCIHII